MRHAAFAALAAIVLVPSLALAERDAQLVGKWGLDGSSEITFELRADGTGEFDDAQVKWSTAKNVLALEFDGERDQIRYVVAGDTVTLEQDGERLQWKRLGAAKKQGALERAKAKRDAKARTDSNRANLDEAGVPDADQQAILDAIREGTGRIGPPVPGPSRAQPQPTGIDAQVTQLLLSSAWCGMKFKSGGTYTGGSWSSTTTKRAVFSRDGTVVETTGGESYNSGSAGTYAGDGSNAQHAYWKVQGGQLLLGVDGANFVPSGATLSYNSNGYPFIKLNGFEYSMCR